MMWAAASLAPKWSNKPLLLVFPPILFHTAMNSAGGLLENIGRNMRQLFRSPVCWALVTLTGAIHLLTEWLGGPGQRPMLGWYFEFGLSREGIFGGAFWSLLTYGLLHGSWWHWGMNALFLLLIGSRIEFVAGPTVLVRALIFGVLGGALGHLLLAPDNGVAQVLVGLSGGCMALLLVFTTLSPESRMMPLPISARSLGLGLIVASLLLSLANFALSLPALSDLGKSLATHGLGDLFKMGHACHLGGALAGWLYGRWLLRQRISLERLRTARMRREASK